MKPQIKTSTYIIYICSDICLIFVTVVAPCHEQPDK